jgi:cellulose biosynthesis protein BcsQ
MNVVVLASRKGGSGKSTLAAHLGAYAQKASGPCLLIDADPQGSLTLWHTLRGAADPILRSATDGIADLVAAAEQSGVAWVFIDTPPSMSTVVTEAIRCATLVIIPARPGVFDLDAVKQTIELTRGLNKPYAVVINAAPARRANQDAFVVAQARRGLAGFNAPVWGGQVSHRTAFSLALAEGENVDEYDGSSLAALEIATLWSAVEQSVQAIRRLSGVAAANARVDSNAA